MQELKMNSESCFGCVLFIHVACLWICVLFYSSFVCLYVYAHDFKSKVHCGVPSGRALPGYRINACLMRASGLAV